MLEVERKDGNCVTDKGLFFTIALIFLAREGLHGCKLWGSNRPKGRGSCTYYPLLCQKEQIRANEYKGFNNEEAIYYRFVLPTASTSA
jgi:hypothetical protein